MGVCENNDNVNHPKHYQGKNECIDVMLAMFVALVQVILLNLQMQCL